MRDRVIRIKLQSSFEKSFALGKIPVVAERRHAQSDLRFGEIRIERDGFLRGFLRGGKAHR